jgi:hypothetical protein
MDFAILYPKMENLDDRITVKQYEIPLIPVAQVSPFPTQEVNLLLRRSPVPNSWL